MKINFINQIKIEYIFEYQAVNQQMRGSAKYPAIHKSVLRIGTNQIDTKTFTSRLCPINRAPKRKTLYDTIAFLIFCPKHRNIAVCNTYHSNGGIAVWLPFIYLSNKVGHSIAIEDGLCLILSDYDFELLFKYKEELPFDTKIFDIVEVCLPKTNKSVLRINCLATLHNNTPGFQCCRKTSRIHWLSVEDICESDKNEFWGPQVRNLCLDLRKNSNLFKINCYLIEGPPMYLAKIYYQNYTLVTCQDYILKVLGITKKQIDLLFIDFFEHCFPSVSMTFDSFVDYLSKYGFRETNTEMRRLFNAFKEYYTTNCTWDFLSFEFLLLGLAYIDGDGPHNRYRLPFVFYYYDQNCDGFLSEDEFREMVTDIHKNEGQEEIDRIVVDGSMTGNESPKGMNYREFINRAISHQFGDATHSGKCDINLIRIIYNETKAKTTRPMDTLIKICSNFYQRNN